MTLVLVDCEAFGGAPSVGGLTEFGAVEFETRLSFHGVLVKSTPDPTNPAVPLPVPPPTHPELVSVFTNFEAWLLRFSKPYVFVSDNPAFDWQWINDGFLRALGHNPFGHSARRIGDYYAGLKGNWYETQRWKGLRKTKHTHHPVDDARGNAEALERLFKGER